MRMGLAARDGPGGWANGWDGWDGTACDVAQGGILPSIMREPSLPPVVASMGGRNNVQLRAQRATAAANGDPSPIHRQSGQALERTGVPSSPGHTHPGTNPLTK